MPTGLTITNAVAVILWVIAALVILADVAIPCGLITSRVFRIGTSLLVGLLSIGVLMNVASSSGWERFG